MNSIDYRSFLKELISTLEADPLVIGLIALGSTADAAYRDRWSDHDFWIITSPGSQSQYLDTFSWLPRADNILITVRHGFSYRTVLYGNKHKVEYAVFDPQEAVRGKIRAVSGSDRPPGHQQLSRINPASNTSGAHFGISQARYAGESLPALMDRIREVGTWGTLELAEIYPILH